MSAVVEKAPRAPVFFEVAPATRYSTCECGKRMYWCMTKNGKTMPVDCDVEGGARPLVKPREDGTGNELIPGRGVAHFGTCPAWKAKRGGTAK